MDKSPIKVLFLDIGGVLLTNGWSHQSRLAASQTFGFDFMVMDALHDMVFSIYEQGSVDLDHYLNTVLFYEPRAFTKEAFRDFMYNQSAELPDTLPWLLQWKAQHPGVRIFSLNNEPRELNDYRIKTFGLHRLFDGFVSSCSVGLRKPDPAIYRLALGIADVAPGECLYIDDRALLVRAGQWAGLPAKQHKSFADTKLIFEGLSFAEESITVR